MLRFVLLRHECPADYRDGPHWDLMVERPGVQQEHRLATWSLLRLPRAWGGDSAGPIAATPLPDHRVRYLEYEGPVSGERGEVRRVATGEAEWLEDSLDEIVIHFTVGDPDPETPTLSGAVTLARTARGDWRLAWESASNYGRP